MYASTSSSASLGPSRSFRYSSCFSSNDLRRTSKIALDTPRGSFKPVRVLVVPVVVVFVVVAIVVLRRVVVVGVLSVCVGSHHSRHAAKQVPNASLVYITISRPLVGSRPFTGHCLGFPPPFSEPHFLVRRLDNLVLLGLRLDPGPFKVTLWGFDRPPASDLFEVIFQDARSPPKANTQYPSATLVQHGPCRPLPFRFFWGGVDA